jgi:hypothetical protein
MKNKMLVLGLIMLSACGSQYSHRMVRVQKQKNGVPECDVVRYRGVQIVKENSEQILSQVQNCYSEVGSSDSKLPALIEEVELNSVKELTGVSNSKSFDRVKDDPPSEDFIKRKYQQANNLAVASLIALISSIFLLILFPVGLIIAFILSLISFKMYRKYENPGVPERYNMAKTVLIISAALLVLLAFLVGAFLYIILVL